MGIHVFAGPTIGPREIAAALPEAQLHPPIGHGDLFRANLRAGDVVLIVDGVFHHHAPVRHKEILHMVANGVHVVGASSMGALRAAELHPYGMTGIGRVFEWYRDGVIEADDEVAVVHTEAPDWRPLSEALVNIRHSLDVSGLPAADSARILGLAKELPYPRRSWSAVVAEVEAKAPALLADVKAVRRVNLKLVDARAALEHVRNLKPGRVEHEWAASDLWRTAYLHRWQQEFTGRPVGEAFVGRTAELRYRQLYDADFPRRWRDFVLTRIGGQGEEAALAQARCHGIDLSTATEWLTEDELATLDERTALLTMLVRSARLDVDLTVADPATDRLLSDGDPAAEVAECLAFNDIVAEQAFFKHTDHLKADKLRDHLVEVWSLPAGCDAKILAAAARERGFSAVSLAIEACRPFFLHRFRAEAVA